MRTETGNISELSSFLEVGRWSQRKKRSHRGHSRINRTPLPSHRTPGKLFRSPSHHKNYIRRVTTNKAFEVTSLIKLRKNIKSITLGGKNSSWLNYDLRILELAIMSAILEVES